MMFEVRNTMQRKLDVKTLKYCFAFGVNSPSCVLRKIWFKLECLGTGVAVLDLKATSLSHAAKKT